MMRRFVVMLAMVTCTVALMTPLACGKYGQPQRVTQLRVSEPAREQVSVSPAPVDPDRDEEASKTRKP
jgi:hypothetical protein